jgi:ubiquinone/menaquinone biosynthesis C-methylase UbiE
MVGCNVMSVASVYKEIAHHFNETRRSICWKSVGRFLNAIPEGSRLFDVGCGNGKYQTFPKPFEWYANDTCEELISIARKRKDVYPASVCYYTVADGLRLPYPDRFCDAGISIAVLHHIPSYEQRVCFVTEMLRVLRPEGMCIITVWSNSDNKDKRKIHGKWTKVNMDPSDSDYLIPWLDRSGHTHMRFYHLFDKDELIQLCKDVGGRLCELYFDENNWNLVIQKVVIA